MNAPERHSLSGSILLITLFIITILSFMLGTAFISVRSNSNTLNQAVSWNQAFVAAEAGVHQGIAQVQTQFVPLLNQNIPYDLSGTQSGTALSGTLTSTGGDGTLQATFGYSLSGIKYGVGVSGTSNYTYFEIISTGTAQVAGTKYTGLDARDAVLRKLHFSSTASVATRQLDVWLKPHFSTDAGLATSSTISMNNHNITVDSFNSTSTSRSMGLVKDVNGNIVTYGQPNSIVGYFNSQSINNSNGGTLTSNQYLASIGTNGQVILAGGSYIYGDAMTNGGVTTNSQNVYGTIRNDYTEILAPVLAPNGTFNYPAVPTGHGNQTQIATIIKNNNTVTLTGGYKSAPARYKLDSVALTGGGQLTFDFGRISGNPDKTQNYVELYIIGDFQTKGGGNGDGAITIIDGVQVKIFVGGNIDLGGNGILNGNGTASSLSIKGISPTDGTARTADFGGTSTFYGTVYAPGYDISLGGTPTYVGNIVGKTATLVGNVAIRYDEALGGAGIITNYQIVHWFENTKQVP